MPLSSVDPDARSRWPMPHKPAMLDVTMPGGGLNAAHDIAAACPATKIVMLTVSKDEDDLLPAMKAGACGYILNGVASRELVAILRRIMDGDVYVTPALAGQLLHEMSRPRATDPISELTDRERAVLEYVAVGLSNFEIGQRLGLSEKTIKHYMTKILGKPHVRSRVEAAILANQAGLGSKTDRGR